VTLTACKAWKMSLKPTPNDILYLTDEKCFAGEFERRAASRNCNLPVEVHFYRGESLGLTGLYTQANFFTGRRMSVSEASLSDCSSCWQCKSRKTGTCIHRLLDLDESTQAHVVVKSCTAEA
jgi:hypothetical protein